MLLIDEVVAIGTNPEALVPYTGLNVVERRQYAGQEAAKSEQAEVWCVLLATSVEIERAIYLLLATRVELSRSSPCLRKPVVLWLQTLYSNCSPLSIRPCSVLWIFMVAFCISLFVVVFHRF